MSLIRVPAVTLLLCAFGGAAATQTTPAFTLPSHLSRWMSIPADIDGDGNEEIVMTTMDPVGGDLHGADLGSVESRERGKILDRFRDDPECRVFLSTDAGGVGLNLQHASVVINVDLPWNPAVLEQRIGRVHRIGQRDPVRVINFVAEGTIEQGMLSVLRFKKSLLAGVLDGGEKEVFLGKGRLDRFMESVESVAAEIQPASSAPETRVDDLDDAAEESAPESRTTSVAAVTPLAEPLARLIESGVGFLHQLAAALPAEASGAGTPRRRIEPRQDADGSMFLAVPLPSRDAVAQLAEGLAALLRSV